MASPLGAPTNKQQTFVPLFVDRAFTGLYTQRSALHDPSDWVTSKFYGGRPDALLDGSNVELTNRLTLQRRPGLSPSYTVGAASFSFGTYPTPPNRVFSFELTDGTIRLIVDTDLTASLQVTSVEAGNGIYHGIFPDGGSNAYVGLQFVITGFTNGANNGTFICTASSTTALTLANASSVAESASAFALSYGGVYYDHQDGTKSILFGKASGAGETRFVAVAGVLYMGDGVEVKKYTPGNPNGEIWNWGITAPANPPSVNIVSGGSAHTNWAASTFFSTMGIIEDSNGNLQQLISVNNLGDNPNSEFGLSSTGGPAWNHVLGGTTVDGGVTWRTVGTLLPWQSKIFYAEYRAATNNPITDSTSIFDAPSNAMYVMNNDLGPTTLQSDPNNHGKPLFNGIPGSTYYEGNSSQITWICLGPINAGNSWRGGVPVVQYQLWVEFPTNPPANQIMYLHSAMNAGTTDASTAQPAWGTNKGDLTQNDNQLLWICLGSGTRLNDTPYVQWTNSQDNSFDAIIDDNGNLQICIQGGTSGSSDPTWGLNYGDLTTDGSVRWANAGPARTWNANTSYHLPAAGFAPATNHSSFGGSAVNDASSGGSGATQYCIASGLSGGSSPSWDDTPGDQTPDNQVTWYCFGTPLPVSISFSTGVQYVYAFKARLANDPYNTSPAPMWQSYTTPAALGVYKGSGTGAVSSASPAAVISSGENNVVIDVTGVGSTDPQVDTIEIYRTTDGGNTFLFLTDIPNPTPSGGNPGTWTVRDYMPDGASGDALFSGSSTTEPGLNPLIQAAIDGMNDPPPNDYLPMAFNYQRIWGGSGSTVFNSGGPDTLVGNPNEAFDATDDYPFLAKVIRAVKTSRGLAVFLTNSVEMIAGGPTTASFFPVTLAPGVGLRSYNALDVYAGEIFFVSADGQFKVISPELQLADFGFPIGDKLVQLDSSQMYVAVLQAGLDACIFIADGSTGWYRLNPRQVPGGFSGPEPIWSPKANITNGCKMVQTVEVQPGVFKLLVGSDDPSEPILCRDLSVYTDNGTAYDAYFTMGSIMLSNPGQIAILKFLEMDFSGQSYTPTVSFLLNEISGSFTPFTANPVFDPPDVYGLTIKPQSYSPNRYYFSGTAQLARCRHMQIKVDFGTTEQGDEMYNMTIFGRLITEP
jgi:hypothetical protein